MYQKLIVFANAIISINNYNCGNYHCIVSSVNESSGCNLTFDVKAIPLQEL